MPLLTLSVRLVKRCQFSAMASTMEATSATMMAQMPATDCSVVSP